MSKQWKAGDEVTVVDPVYEAADDHSPGGYLARPGEKLIVRQVRDRGQWPISVSHETVTDGSAFSVSTEELKAYVQPTKDHP